MGLLNVDGYYDLLVAFIDRSVQQDLCNPRVLTLLDGVDDRTSIGCCHRHELMTV